MEFDRFYSPYIASLCIFINKTFAKQGLKARLKLLFNIVLGGFFRVGSRKVCAMWHYSDIGSKK